LRPSRLASAAAVAAVAVLAVEPLAGADGHAGLGVSESLTPINKTLPRITGKAREGLALSATRGVWAGPRGLTYRYNWLRCRPGGTRCSTIAAATRLRYVLQASDVGSTLRVRVTAVAPAGQRSVRSAPTAVVQPAPTQTRLVALWHMDETSGTVMHDAVSSHDGALTKVALGVPGDVGTAFGFNGSSSVVVVPSAADLNPGTANITITVHLKTTGVPGAPPVDWDLIRKGDYSPAGSEYKFELQHTGQGSCGFEGSSGYGEVIAGPPLNDGQWHTVACAKTPTTIKLIVDGKSYVQTAYVGSIDNDAPVVLGSRPGADWYAGSLDEASIEIG
jgi:hypothetical protein